MQPTLIDKHVLSIDDSRAIRAFVSTLLSNAGAHVAEAGNGTDAIRQVTSGEQQYDLILLDLVLPDIEGLDVLKEIRKYDTESTVVVLTGAGGVASATAAMQFGADGYIEKQYMTQVGGEPEFFYALQQAMEHRAGFVAKQQLDQLRTDFYSMITHDLRNPAGTVLGFLKLVLAGKVGPLQPKQEELLRTAQKSAEKLVSLITDYLDYSKIEAGYLRLEPEMADLTTVVRNCAAQANGMASAKEQTLLLDLPEHPLYGYFDADRLEHVFDNLLSNAIKYTPDHGTITLTLSQQGDEATFQISDTGMGIPRAEIGALFTKYHRVPNSNRRASGTGLGLLIVKEIVEAHHGTISVESEGMPGKGSTFTIHLPLNALIKTEESASMSLHA
jgi:signal transduction histidine kinase